MSGALAIVAHPDDETLGCGATLAQHAIEGDEVHILILGTGVGSRDSDPEEEDIEEKRRIEQAISAASMLGARCPQICATPDNRFDSVVLLDIVKRIERTIAEVQPNIIYTHSSADLNIDHALTHRAVLTAARPLPGSSVKRILAFEVPSATECGLRTFAPNVFVDVTGEPFLRKLRALEHYASEMRAFPHPRSEDAVTALAKWRGASVGVTEAEAFELIRHIE